MIVFGVFCNASPHSYPFSAGQVQVQQQMNEEEYAAMQERENAIAQLEVQETSLQREMREEEDRELAKLEQDITTMAEVFVETQRLVHGQGETVGKNPMNNDWYWKMSFLVWKFDFLCKTFSVWNHFLIKKLIWKGRKSTLYKDSYFSEVLN